MCIYDSGQNRKQGTVHDRIFGDFSAKHTVYTPYMTEYFGDFPAKIPYIHRTYINVHIYMVQAVHIRFRPTLHMCIYDSGQLLGTRSAALAS
jgi:hypothetical protein